MKKWKFIFVVALSFFGLIASTGVSADLKEFKFGLILAMTGSGSWYGMTMERGTRIAIEEINKAGGVSGYKFSCVAEDH